MASYAGETVVNSGRLTMIGLMNVGAITVNNSGTFVTGSSISSLTVNNGGTFLIGNLFTDTTVGTVNAGSVVLNTGSTVEFNLGSNLITGNDKLNVSGTAQVDGNIRVTFFAAPTEGVYTLISAANVLATSPTLLHNLPSGTRSTFALNTTATAVNLTVTGSAKDLIWSGSNGNEWSTATTTAALNWIDPSALSENFYQLDSVRFDDTLTGSALINIVGTVQPSKLVVDSSTTDYTFAGPGTIAGAGSILKKGTSTLTLSANSTLSGNSSLIISQGTVVATSSNSIGINGITIGNSESGAFDVAFLVDNTTISNLIATTGAGTGKRIVGSKTSSANGVVSVLSNLFLYKETTLQGGDADGTVFSGLITGNVGTLTVTGGNRVEFTNGSSTSLNNFVGNVQVSGAGTVLRTNANTITDTANVDVGTGAKWELNGAETINALTGSGTISHNTAAQTLTVGLNNGSGVFSGNIAGLINFSKIGNGTQQLGGNNTFTGTVSISNGVLLATHNNAVGTNNNVTIAGDSAENRAPSLSLQGGVTLNVNNLSTSGVGLGSANGALHNASGDNTINVAGTFQIIGGNGGSTYSSAAGLLTLNAATIAPNVASRTLTLRGAGNGELNASLQDGSTVNLPLIKQDAGTWTLSKDNTYGGTTSVQGGVLQVGKSGVGSSGTGALTVNSGATLAGSGVVKAATSSVTHTISNGGILRPGDASGTGMATLTVQGNLNLGTSAQTFLQIGASGVNDKILRSGTNSGLLTLDGTIKVDFSGYAPAYLDSWTLIDWVGFNAAGFNTGTNYRSGATGSGEGDFDLPDLTVFNASWFWDIDFNSTTGLARITVVPEPGRCMLMIFALSGLLFRRTRSSFFVSK